ncbi:MAG TPA: hypothetical protein VK607_13630 [Kofleriaceae bacterium]|nr:hypothetical protein [Kofleriaceae bacterium]
MTRFAYLSLLLGSMFPACAGSDGAPDPEVTAPIELRHPTGEPVSGSAFACTDHAPDTLTPCEPYARQRAVIRVMADAERDAVELGLSRNSDWIEVDGAGATAVLALRFLEGGGLTAGARQDIVGERGVRRSFPREGWIEPVELSSTPDRRNAGRFSLTFDWGTISGTYDSVDAR